MLKIYNTLGKRLEEFKPIKNGKVGMYVCGVTVYDNCHIGHARSAVAFDVMYRYLKFKGYDVTFVKNFTDVDDKIINRANEEGVSCNEIAQRYIGEYYKDMYRLNIAKPEVEPKATEHINEIIELVRKLQDMGYAYEVNGDVYYRVEKFKDYGKLSGKNIDELKSGARVEINDKKENPLDFALWKRSKENEPKWKSPWGEGRPGWHIECSAMSMKYLGESFDIHGGGEDLIFPHHENEIAQSEAATGKPFARYWIHNGFVRINKEKMSKSLGNFFTIKDILKKYDGQTLRYFLLLTHYRSPIDFSFEGLDAAKEALNRYYNFIQRLEDTEFEKNGKVDELLEKRLKDLLARFEEAMDEDFNAPKAIGEVFSVIKTFNQYLDSITEGDKPKKAYKETFLESMNKIKSVLGVFDTSSASWFIPEGIDVDWVEERIKQRALARKNKDYETADKIRDELNGKGIILEDAKEYTRWKVKR
ncbi:cysteine--tRNA ligase [Hippea maritima]|uniref:Cysteine--tRNA ligase n=1 Tax=Hippea maritima (strain ATCC 700847 / DSM 10411 / MH2) TaxID=760142 RepID=F2LVX8_HIPMA|nr:cysteine--tRNA ligase [Hippea maritima]AEA33912.1 cysteinyl-tRNA synthetase [Hippea maritima DSM 10411]